MQQLLETQRWLASIILAPEKLEDAAFSAEIGDVLATSPEAVIARLRAYTGGYPARIEEALEEAYPALKHVIGALAFHGLAHRYLPAVPTGIDNLNDVGALLPSFLERDEIAGDYPFAADLARLEHAVHRAFHACEREPFDPASAAEWTLEDWSAAVLELQPSVAVVSSPWPVAEIWHARETPIAEIDIELEGRGQTALVYRSGDGVVCEAVDTSEGRALELILGGATLAETVQKIAAGGGNPDDVTRWFARWSGCGLVARVRRGD